MMPSNYIDTNLDTISTNFDTISTIDTMGPIIWT